MAWRCHIDVHSYSWLTGLAYYFLQSLASVHFAYYHSLAFVFIVYIILLSFFLCLSIVSFNYLAFWISHCLFDISCGLWNAFSLKNRCVLISESLCRWQEVFFSPFCFPRVTGLGKIKYHGAKGKLCDWSHQWPIKLCKAQFSTLTTLNQNLFVDTQWRRDILFQTNKLF